MSIQRIIANNTNLITDATLVATSVTSSNQISQTKAIRQGNGNVALTGPYTGHDNAIIDVEIVSNNTGNTRVSTPIFTGSGSGKISNIVAGSLTAQSVTITLSDMGISTQKAILDFYGVTLQAKVAGVAGNAISITCSDAGIVKTASTASLFNDIVENQEIMNGVENNFNALTLTAKGDMDAASVRMTFGEDPQVYRQYKKFVKNDWEYHLVPAAARKINDGTIVNIVTGSYTITITDGSVTETYTDIITLYDLLYAIQQNSALIEIIGAVTKDMQPNGMATVDLNLKTSSYNLPISRSQTSMLALTDIVIPPLASTQKLLLTCADNSIVGQEIWNVKGSVSGDMGSFYTGALAQFGSGFQLRVPVWMPTAQTETNGSVGIADINYQVRNNAETSPEFCVSGKLGIAARSQTITATFTKYKKTEDCNCANASISGAYNYDALGLPAVAGGSDMLDPVYKSRLEELYEWKRDFIIKNTVSITSVSDMDIEWMNPYFDLLKSSLPQIYTNSDALVLWDALKTEILAMLDYNDIGTGNDSMSFQTISTANDFISDSAKWQYHLTITKLFEKLLLTNTSSSVTIKRNNVDVEVENLNVVFSSNPASGYFTVDVYYLNNGVITEEHKQFNFTIASTTRSTIENQIYKKAYIKQYEAKLDLIYLAAGMIPGKDNPSTNSGAGLWTGKAVDYWELSDGYAPAYTNEIYHSTKLKIDQTPYQTKEFAFVISCACPSKIKIGDKITIRIEGSATTNKTYEVNSTYEIPVISAAPARLAGGVNGDDTITWDVKAMTSGNLSPYQIVNNQPLHYEDLASGLEFDMALGGIPFALGDQFRFSIESGQFRWRLNNGTWSSNNSIEDSTLVDGIKTVFTPGAYPSYVPGDFFQFAVLQPASPYNILQPKSTRNWSFATGGAITITPPAAINGNSIAIVHTLPVGTKLNITGITGLTQITTGSCGIEFVEFESQDITEMTITSLAAGTMIYVYVGTPLTTENAPDSIELRRQWEMIHGQKSNFGAVYVAQGYSGKIAWKNFISKSEFDNHIAMIDYVKRNGDEPIIFIPHHLHPSEAFMCRVEADQVDMIDLLQFHPNDETNRVMSLTIPFSPITK